MTEPTEISTKIRDEAVSEGGELKEDELPKLSKAEFKAYNGMAEHMEYYHNHFRQTWTQIYKACSANQRPSGMSINQFLSVGEMFCSRLELHHSIEEQHIFPVLATRMRSFRKELELLTQHKQIHAGVKKMNEYFEDCRRGGRELRLGELKEIMDGFGDVLWQHLDEEVKTLGAENMRKYWTVQEMSRMPM